MLILSKVKLRESGEVIFANINRKAHNRAFNLIREVVEVRNYEVATLTIAGSDSSGGAGIQADLKTFSSIGTYGMSVITAITAQNTTGVSLVEEVSPQMVEEQIRMVLDDILPKAIKIGMVSSEKIIHSIVQVLKEYEISYLIVDPVMISKSGYDLLSPTAKRALINELIPRAYMLTPNIPEAEALTGMKIDNLEDMKKAGEQIRQLGPQFVYMKGGHLNDDATDVLIGQETIEIFSQKRLKRKNTHGTGCTLSAAIAAHLALGSDTRSAVLESKKYITAAIEYSFDIGKGIGPVHHFYQFEGEKNS